MRGRQAQLAESGCRLRATCDRDHIGKSFQKPLALDLAVQLGHQQSHADARHADHHVDLPSHQAIGEIHRLGIAGRRNFAH